MRATFVFLTLLITTMQASESTWGADSKGDVSNAAPEVVDIDLPASVPPVAGGQAVITVEFAALDGNGKADLVNAEIQLLKPDNATAHRHGLWAIDPDITNGERQDINTTISMDYWDAPGTYHLAIRVQDAKERWSERAYASFDYQALAAITLGATDVGFGGAQPGQRSAPVEVTVQNAGNVAVDIEVSGTDLVASNGVTIPVSHIRYDETSDFAGESALGTTPTMVGTALAPGPTSTTSVWWLLDAPSGNDRYVPAGNYQGSVTINAVAA